MLEVAISARENADDFVRHILLVGLVGQVGFKTLAIEKGGKESLFSIVRNAEKQGLPEETIANIVGLDADAIKKY
jgi:hypothetical protein